MCLIGFRLKSFKSHIRQNNDFTIAAAYDYYTDNLTVGEEAGNARCSVSGHVISGEGVLDAVELGKETFRTESSVLEVFESAVGSFWFVPMTRVEGETSPSRQAIRACCDVVAGD